MRFEPRDLFCVFVHPDRARQLVDDILGAILWLVALSRLEIEGYDFVTPKDLSPHRSDLADAQEIGDRYLVGILLLLAALSRPFLLLFFFLPVLQLLFDFLLHAFVFFFALGLGELLAVCAYQALDETAGDRRD